MRWDLCDGPVPGRVSRVFRGRMGQSILRLASSLLHRWRAGNSAGPHDPVYGRGTVRGASDAVSVDTRQEPLRQTIRFMATQTSFVLALAGFCLTSYTNFGLSVWVPAFMRRVHHLSNGEIGTYTGTVRGLVAMAGALLGGFVVERLSRKDQRWMMRAPAMASGIGGPVLLIFLFSKSTAASIAGLAVASLLIAFHIGPIWAFGQATVKVGMRSFSQATLSVVASLVALGLAPLLIGMMNDRLKVQYGDLAIRYSMITTAVASSLGAILFWCAANYIDRDLCGSPIHLRRDNCRRASALFPRLHP